MIIAALMKIKIKQKGKYFDCGFCCLLVDNRLEWKNPPSKNNENSWLKMGNDENMFFFFIFQIKTNVNLWLLKYQKDNKQKKITLH